MGEYNVRFRHTNGDLGPYAFPSGINIGTLKERLMDAWPTEGPLVKDAPSSPAELRLICGGRFLEDGQSLRAVSNVVGEPSADLLVTVHVLVRPAGTGKPYPGAGAPETSKSCCVIC